MTTNRPVPLPLTTPIDWAEAYLICSLGLGLVFSLLLTADAIQDFLVTRKQPHADRRRTLATGLLLGAAAYTILKAFVFYLAVGLIYPLPIGGPILRVGLAAAFNISDLGIGLFWYYRKKSL